VTEHRVGDELVALAGSFAFPRRAGSDGSGRIVKRLTENLERLGLEVNHEDFSYDLGPVERGLRLFLVGGAALIFGSAWLTAEHPGWSAILLLGGFLFGALMLGWSPWLERLYRRPGPTHTTNIDGRRPVASPGRRIILMAHHDSKSQSLALPARMGSTVGAMVGAAGGACLVATALIAGTPPGPSWLPLAVGAVGSLSLLALATMTSGDLSPGGVDNAGSLAIVLEVADRILKRAIEIELVVLFTGAEEDHMVGAMRWLDRHTAELNDRETLVLNFDGAGSPGRTVLITRFGAGRRFAPGLERVAVDTARSVGEPVRRIIMAPAVGIDAIPFAHRGIECLTLSSGSLGRATYAVHSAGDVAENLDGETMARIADYAEAIVERLTENGSGRPVRVDSQQSTVDSSPTHPE
jgi:hypothetical protein